MSIGDAMSIDCITRSNFERLARECAMSPKLILSRLDALAARIVDVAERLVAETSGAHPSPVYGKIVEVIVSQVRRMGH